MKRKEIFEAFRDASVGARRRRRLSYSPWSSLFEKSSREERVAFVIGQSGILSGCNLSGTAEVMRFRLNNETKALFCCDKLVFIGASAECRMQSAELRSKTSFVGFPH